MTTAPRAVPAKQVPPVTYGRPVTLAPSRLEYALAFDWLACTLGEHGLFPARLSALVSTPEFVDLALARATGSAAFLPSSDMVARHVAARQEQGYLPAVQSQLEGLAAALLWAAPQQASWRSDLTTIQQRLAPRGHAGILVGTRAGAALAPLRRGRQPGDPCAVPGLLTALSRPPWRVAAQRGFGSAAGAAWALLARVADRLNRPDLADRAERAYYRHTAGGALPSYVALVAKLAP